MGIESLEKPPHSKEIEFTLFGPGFGESGVIHLGNNNWVIIDSCIDNKSGEPAALVYLRKIGVRPEEAVKLIVATHWHDDHVRGLTELVTICKEAEFCCSSAYTKEEFLAYIASYNSNNKLVGGSGAEELFSTMKVLERTKTRKRLATENKKIYVLESKDTDHGHACEIWTLSPSDMQIETSLKEIAQLIPKALKPKKRAVNKPNHASVVVWVQIGSISVLWGADMEENPNKGWSVIVESKLRPQGKAAIYKIAHHGSENAHHDKVWEAMLIGAPFAILAPYNRTPLPKETDRDRICALSKNAFSTAKLKSKKSPKRPQMVEKMIEQTVKSISCSEPPTGAVRLRNSDFKNVGTWSVELLNTACHLSDIYT